MNKVKTHSSLELFKYIIIALFLSSNLNISGQIEQSGAILTKKGKELDDISFIQLGPASMFKEHVRARLSRELKKDDFAAVHQINYSPENSGYWHTLTNGSKVWRLGLTSSEASSLGISFSQYRLKPGITVFIYTPDREQIAGAYNFRNNKNTGILTTSSLYGDSIIIEMQVSGEVYQPDMLVIGTISIGFPEKSTTDNYYGRSASCHVDINCIDNDTVQHQKYSACRLVIEGQYVRTRCTGTLLNNTSQNATPYVLTAGHCVDDLYDAHHTLFYFDYESPYCNGPDSKLKSISGSHLRSNAGWLDFSLLELSEQPPVDYYPIYSGWNASDEGVDRSYVIHHPEGDVKKYSVDEDPASTGSFSTYVPNSFWIIQNYEIGTTENGSSGGALFNQDNEVVGILSGGGDTCIYNIYDYYQKLSFCWDLYPEEDQQLKHWLDPENTGALKIENLDVYRGASEKISKYTETDTPELAHIENGWGYISGHNSLGSVEFAEPFSINGSKYIHAVNMNIGLLSQLQAASKIKLKIWDGSKEPDNLLFEKEVYHFEMVEGVDNYIRLDTLIYVDKKFFIGYEIAYSTPLDSFVCAVVDPAPGLHYSYAQMNRGDGWEPLNNGISALNSLLAVSVQVLNYYPPRDAKYGEYPFDPVTLYPNPARDNIQILLEKPPTGNVEIKFFDLFGHLVYQYTFIHPEPNFSIKTRNILASGMYIVSVEYDGEKTLKKLIKLD